MDVELETRFGKFADRDGGLQPEVLGELHSMLGLYTLDPEELYYKWESYCIKMAREDMKLDLKTARDLKKDIEDDMDRKSRSKAQAHSNRKRPGATPRTGGKNADVLDGIVPNTPRPNGMSGVDSSTTKRKSNFETPASKVGKSHPMSSPGGPHTPYSSSEANGLHTYDFSARKDMGKIEELLNGHIELAEAPEEPPMESRLKLKTNTDMKKFSYKTMAMKLTEASEVLDDRIDEFKVLVQDHHKLEDSAFGNPGVQSTSEIVAVGRIASDAYGGRLNNASLVLESSRRMGSGNRIPLRVDAVEAYNFFPGQIVALRGTNASGAFFTVNEILSLPLLPQAATKPQDLEALNARYLDTPSSDPSHPRPLTILAASGPFTPDTVLDFSALQALLDTAISSVADALILTGPFLDAEHPLVRSGDFDLPASATNPDQATITDVFRHYVSKPLQAFSAQLPTCTIILVPSLRDAVHRHAAWPQDKLPKKELGLPRQAHVVTNPMTLTINEFVVAMSSVDTLDMLRREECVGGKAKAIPLLERGARSVIEQRSFLPIFPPTGRENMPPVAGLPGGEKLINKKDDEEETSMPSPFLPLGAMVDTSYMKLGEWLNVRPDIFISPSVLSPFAKFIETILVINPGTLSKRRSAGTYARLTILPASLTDEESEAGVSVAHRMWERTRVDIVRI
ncbi:DNA polymerase alpha, subunit B [Lophium mytilinum]|uniref:DNA polymerase alpha subunit B n=1 Tax=Lophium mytilinum TaxID=390894 RepID=A0A6A6QD37_9PEZI|nr:DNA polymerase alpha, subunit B [Lophium mytilinum]